MNVDQVRRSFVDDYNNKKFRSDGNLELRGVSFDADEDCIFGSPNRDYIDAEIKWYETQDKSVHRLFDIYGKKVKIWEDVCDGNGEVNSNYGWRIYSEEQGNQFDKVFRELVDRPNTRQAILIYQHPEMHLIAGKDFTCTNAQQFFIEGDTLECVVQMRSQDAVFGYNNDIAWFHHVHTKMINKINEVRLSNGEEDLSKGSITMQIGSLHVYPRHQHLLTRESCL